MLPGSGRLARRVGALTALVVALLSGLVGVSVVSPAGAAPPVTSRSAEYVSLGDSYVAVGSHLSTSLVGRGCLQASDSVGKLVARQMPGVHVVDRSCGSAQTGDMLASTGRSGPQLESLSTRTRYVSVSIGGNNDRIFSGGIACVLLRSCSVALERSQDATFGRLAKSLDRVYAEIARRAPNATVVVVSSLRIVPGRSAGCFIDVGIGQRGTDFANRLQDRLNAVTAAAADRAGFIVVNQHQDDRHTICARDGYRYVSLTGIGPGDQGVYLHPTLLGRAYTARLIADAFGR